jgi:AmmeMemoRadiSam system protein B
MRRPMLLAQGGWYSRDREAVKKNIESLIDSGIRSNKDRPIAAISPHASWFYCGKLIVNSIRILQEKNSNVKNIFIFGGHLHKESDPILETFSVADTPLGGLNNNGEVIDFLSKYNSINKKLYLSDNTIEVILPIIKYFFDDANITALYLPPNTSIVPMIEELVKNFGDNSIFIGSTDLTHYGPRYNFTIGNLYIPDAVKWVNKNDKGYIDLILSMREDAALEYAIENMSACSAGAVLATIVAAKIKGIKSGELLGYYTSYDIRQDNNFVGYCGILY